MPRGEATTPDQIARFLEKLCETGIVRRAVAHAGISYRTAYDIRARDEGFAEAWNDALAEGLGRIEESLVEMATGYVEREQYDEHGNLRNITRRRDVKAAQLILAARLAEYRSAHSVQVDAKAEVDTTQRREIDLKGELKNLDRDGRAHLREVLRQLSSGSRA